MQINPKYNFYLGIAVTIEIAISHGTIGFTNAIPAGWIPTVVAWAGILAFAGSTVMTYMAAYSSAVPGPMIGTQTPLPAGAPTSPAVTLLPVLIAAGLALAWAGPAAAQQRQAQPFKPTGNLVNDLKAANGDAAESKVKNAIETFLAKPFQDIATFIGDDSAAAIALSTVVPELQDGHGQQCWMAMKQFGEVAKAHPVPLTLKIQTDVEAFRLLGMAANNLCANPHCTQVFADMANAVQTMAPLNASIPIPSLHDLCSKVPQFAVAPPITVPPAAATSPAAP